MSVVQNTRDNDENVLSIIRIWNKQYESNSNNDNTEHSTDNQDHIIDIDTTPVIIMIDVLFLEILDILDEFKEIRDRLSYSNIEDFLRSVIFGIQDSQKDRVVILPFSSSSTLSSSINRLVRILKNDFLLQNRYHLRRLHRNSKLF